MKKIYLLIIIFFALANNLKAQDNQPPVYQITADTAIHLAIPDKYWQLLEDPSGTLTIGQVSSAEYSSKFHYNTTRSKGYNYNIDTYWMRYRFKNLLHHPVKITIPERVAYAWLYLPKPNNQWQVKTNGQFVPWSKRDGLKLARQFVVSMDTGQELTLYEKDVNDFNVYKPKVFELAIGFADPVIKTTYIDNLSELGRAEVYGMIFGFLLLAAIINLLFFGIVREKVYLFFGLFVFFQGLWLLIVRTFCTVLSEDPRLTLWLSYLSLIIVFYTMMQFVRYFLLTMVYTPKWDKVLVVFSFIVILLWMWAFFGGGAISYKNDRVINLFTQGLIYCYYPFALGTLIYFIPRQRGADRTGIYAILPAFFWLSFGYAFLGMSDLLNDAYDISYSRLYFWILKWFETIELVCFLWLVIGFSLILFKRFRVMQQGLILADLDKERLAKEKEIERSQLIEKQKAELEIQVASRTAELKHSLDELKTTQSQLIQSEKMASLGELTAGIAHEIQNPLNFVNNFSEVNIELITEMQTELESGTKEEVIEILEDIKQNLEKISHHGKRADGIVKGMLQHSRASSNIKEPTDINKLADEYLRLTYHGLRAKDKSFNAELVTHFADDLPLVSIVPQDIGRALLNLFTNAFYAVQQKQKTAGADYKPTVELSTFIPPLASGGLGVKVRDNGGGIPENIREKILQPFFTTKPTGEGTGLGLSLSYEIVVNGHGGTIEIDSKEGEFTEFIIKLPV